jgi:hypothetical protein
MLLSTLIAASLKPSDLEHHTFMLLNSAGGGLASLRLALEYNRAA